MSVDREPLHQPPHPDEIRSRPPKTVECAFVRGLLRDFVDGDLDAEQGCAVEEHASRCRHCSVELGRTEHERMLIRNLFAAVRKQERASAGGGRLAPGFAARVTERLVVDETSMISRASLQRGVAAADAARSAARTAGPGSDSRLAVPLQPLQLLAAAMALLLLLVVGTWWFERDPGQPSSFARLVVVSARGTFDLSGRRIGAGNGLSEQQSLRVSKDGRATLQWHDRTDRPQPAAILDVGGDGQLVLQGGAPLLIKGRIEIEANRPVSIALADGSQLDLGAGNYVIVATSPFEDVGDVRELTELGAELDAELDSARRVEVEVILGEAGVVRPGAGAVVVGAGQVGIYVGGGPIAIGPAAGRTVNAPVAQRESVEPPSEEPARLFGLALEGSGFPAQSASLLLSLAHGGNLHDETCVSGLDGRFELRLDHGAALDFAIVHGMGNPSRPMLGMLPPDAVRLRAQGGDRFLERNLTFDTAPSLTGHVADDSGSGQPLAGVQVIPCIVDEIFGSVMLWECERTVTDGNGMFRVDRLPVRLPQHQGLGLLFYAGSAQASYVASFVPVPLRSGLLAAWTGSFVMKRQRPSRLHWLPKNSTLTILEEIVGAPWRSAVRKHIVTSDSDGKVNSVDLGPGPLWLRWTDQGTEMVHLMYQDAMEQSGSALIPRYRPVAAAALPLHTEFRTMQTVNGTALEVVHSHRHQRIVAPPTTSSSSSLSAMKSGSPEGGAQVFAVDDLGGGLGVAVRFMGFTLENMGAIPTGGLGPTDQVVVIAADGSVAMVGNPRVATNVTVSLERNGGAILPPALRPAPALGGDWTALRFERIDNQLAGLRSAAYRFASAATGWEVGGLLPGAYRVFLGTSEVPRQVVIPSDGFAEIQ